jgi:KAP family P-loop domain
MKGSSGEPLRTPARQCRHPPRALPGRCSATHPLNLIEARLKEEEVQYIVVRFDAWLYQGFDDARAALMEAIAARLVEETERNAKKLRALAQST